MIRGLLPRSIRLKKSKAAQASPTPILDLLEPLPKPADEIITGKFAFPLLTLIVISAIDKNYSFLTVLLCFLPALFLVLAIHECGHLLFGWLAGLAFRGVDIGPLCLLRIRTNWILRLRPRVYAGAAHMVLRRVRRIRRQLAICTLGGPVISYGFALVAFFVGEVYRPTDSFGWTTFLEFSAFLSLVIGLFSTFPYRTRIGGNDAFILRQLLASKIGSMQMIAAHAAYFAGGAEPIPPAYFERWWKLSSLHPETGYSPFYAGWNAYRAAKDPASAASHLEQLLSQSAWHDVQTRNFLAAEAAYFTARHRPASSQSSVWLQRAKHLEWLDPLSRIRLDIALAESRQEFAQALAGCDSGLALIRANLNGPSSIKMESEWADWRKLIEELANPETCEIFQLC